MDFATGLPRSNDYDAIWVVVDRLTKQRHLVPCRTSVDARDLADLFLQHVFRLHGLTLTITSDRAPQFASAFWHRLCARLGVEPRLSTAFHPQTDGQTEQMNAVMEQYLRSYVNYLQDDSLTGYRLPSSHRITIFWKRLPYHRFLRISDTTLAGNLIFAP